MKIHKVSVLIQEGSYVLGDPCYVVPDADWDSLLASCNYFTNPIGYVKDGIQRFPVLGFSTYWGDGSYKGSDGNVYPVDSGLLGLVPAEMVEDLSKHEANVISFPKDTLCVDDGSGLLRFGHISIDTNPSEEEVDA